MQDRCNVLMTAGGTSAPCSKAASECTALTLPKGWMNRTKVVIRTRFVKRVTELFVCVKRLGFEGLVFVDDAVGNVVFVDPHNPGTRRHRQCLGCESKIVDLHFQSGLLVSLSLDGSVFGSHQNRHCECGDRYKIESFSHRNIPSCFRDLNYHRTRAHVACGRFRS